MQFRGRNLELVREGLTLAIAEYQNQIVTCPNAFEYAEDIEELEALVGRFKKLTARIERAQAKEGRTASNPV